MCPPPTPAPAKRRFEVLWFSVRFPVPNPNPNRFGNRLGGGAAGGLGMGLRWAALGAQRRTGPTAEAWASALRCGGPWAGNRA
jgi:predicted lipid-binding transport protein (Tim44 family)